MPHPDRRRHGPQPDRRRALELLASCCDGFEAIMLAHGFTIEQIVFVLLHSGRAPSRGLDISFVHSSPAFTPDGKMTREPLAESGHENSGTWKLNAKGFCTTWQHAKPNCFTVIPKGDNSWSVQTIATTIATTVAV
jgi:hypothetical protein